MRSNLDADPSEAYEPFMFAGDLLVPGEFVSEERKDWRQKCHDCVRDGTSRLLELRTPRADARKLALDAVNEVFKEDYFPKLLGFIRSECEAHGFSAKLFHATCKQAIGKAIREFVPEDQEAKAVEAEAPDALPVNHRDLGKFFDSAKLTSKQRECASLRWEYELPVLKIATRLHVVRKTVDDHIAAARQKIDKAGLYEKMKKQLAKSNRE